MGYTLDLTMEKLLHSLQELIIVRRRITMANLEDEPPETAILSDAILDLAEGIARYAGHPDPGKMAHDLAGCHFTYDLPKVFRKEGMSSYLAPPYFSQKDLEQAGQ